MDLNIITTDSIPPLSESIVYKKIIPWIIISLTLFYTAFLLFRYCSWGIRRQRARKRRMDRQKVARFWRKRAVDIQAKSDSIQTLSPIYNNRQQHHHRRQYYDGLQSFDSSATLVVLSSGNHPYHCHDNTGTLSSEESPLHEKKESVFLYSLGAQRREQRQTFTIETNHDAVMKGAKNIKKKKKTSNKYKKLVKSVLQKFDDTYHQNKKRRYLLWQWSVAMGYCKYHHAYYLNTMIDRLQEEKKYNNVNI
ncbi:MAG: hypothetical protein EXX96DRAFT_543728 [Benjaminiella poitrasii]|nr:MAG: hypothetical protein EXX96DRAFT_543728 [Benjaminiella poitrasii]